MLLSFVSTTFWGFFEASAEIKKCSCWFLVQMKTLKFAFEINWPLNIFDIKTCAIFQKLYTQRSSLLERNYKDKFKVRDKLSFPSLASKFERMVFVWILYKWGNFSFFYTTVHRGTFFQCLFRWIYCCHSSKSTGKETGKTHLCVLY